MGGLATAVTTGLFSLGETLIDRLISDPEENTKAKQKLIKMQQKGELEVLNARMSAITAEANSEDPWTSRARPTFLYVFYLVILSLVMIAPCIGVFFPDQMHTFFANVKLGFDAIPDELWILFGTGYLGYSGLRTIEKRKKNSPL